MNIIITMAGLGSRFKKAGYDMPKFKIEVKGKTLFEWSMLSLKNLNQENARYIFVVRKEDEAYHFIMNKTKEMGITDIHIIEIDELTDGQATTVLLAEKDWKYEEEMMVYNIDTYVEPDAIKYSDFKGEGFIPCFNALGEHWSFVKVDENRKALEVREKTRISNHCTIGLYYFKSCKLYKELYRQYYNDNAHLEKGEKYIAPLYNCMIEKGMEVYISNIDKEKVHVLGTPEEVERFKEEK